MSEMRDIRPSPSRCAVLSDELPELRDEDGPEIELSHAELAKSTEK